MSTATEWVEYHIEQMNDWIDGRRSWCNFGPHEPYTPDVIATMDAQEVAKHAEAIRAYGALVEVGIELPDIPAVAEGELRT